MIQEKLECFFEEISLENIQKHLNYLCRFELLERPEKLAEICEEFRTRKAEMEETG